MVTARKRMVERVGEINRERHAEHAMIQERLTRTETRIKGLLQFIADEDEQSEYAWATVRDLEAQAKADKTAMELLERQAQAPIRLPSPDDIRHIVFDLEARLAADPLRAREWLRRLFADGRIVLTQIPGRVYMARSRLLPLMLTEGTTAGPDAKKASYRRFGGSEPTVSSQGSGGRI
jgi:hypothetical protein